MQGLGFKVQGSGYGFQRLVFRVQGFGLNEDFGGSKTSQSS